MGAVPGNSSILNSTSRSGGSPGKSSGKMSENSLWEFQLTLLLAPHELHKKNQFFWEVALENPFDL
jgi:hypothetical protein